MTIMDDQPRVICLWTWSSSAPLLYNYCTYDRDTLFWFIFHLFDEDDSGALEALEFKDWHILSLLPAADTDRASFS